MMFISTLSCDGAARNAYDCTMDLGCARLVEASVATNFRLRDLSTRIRSEEDMERKMRRVGRQHVRDNNA